MDGGSTDETARLVAQSESTRLFVVPGLGQAASVNRGVEEARGNIIIVVNADDVIYPTAVQTLVNGLAEHPDVAAVYGDAVHIDEHDEIIESYPTRPFDAAALIESCYICQPAAAVRRAAFESVGGLDARLHYAMDYDFWIRLSSKHRLQKIPGLVAGSRMHRANKTLARRADVYREVIHVLRAHYGYVPYTWAFAYASWLLDGNDQFFDQRAPSRAAVLASLALGLRLNPGRPFHYIHDWYGHRSFGRRS